MGEVSNPGLTLAELSAAMPAPATSAPPPVAIDGATGANLSYARADHTHESRLQARRIQVTPDANGRYVYTFPKAYPAGIIPIVTVTAETATGLTYRNDASLMEGSTSNTQTTILITKLNQNVVTGLLNAVLPVFAPQTGVVWVNILSRAPS